MDDFDGCGMGGSAKTANLKKINQMKNRYAAPQPNEVDQSVTLSSILAPGDDKTRWGSTSGAEVTGFVLDVKPGGGLRAHDCVIRACVEQQGRWVLVHGGVHEDHAIDGVEGNVEGSMSLCGGDAGDADGEHEQAQREQTPCTRRVPRFGVCALFVGFLSMRNE